MLNKDEYNQKEYNDYYRQEVEGIKIGDSSEGGLMSKLIMLLVLSALIIAGYFGYKTMNNSSVDDIDTSLQVSAESSLPQSEQGEAEPKELEAVATTQGKMSAEEVASVVAAVMQQMNQEKTSDTSNISTEEDTLLMSELLDLEVDSLSVDLMNELENGDISKNTKIDNTQKQVDVYNKVNVQNILGADILSQLSEQINSVMTENVNTNKVESYTNSLKSEVNVRKNEMRIIVVRQGDTLGKIAKRAYGNVMEYEKIYRANPELTRPDRIHIGQKLRIPN